MREPVFNETLQLGIVVRDLDASLRRYVEDYGIGPWEIHEFDPENAEDLHEYGQPVGRSWRGHPLRYHHGRQCDVGADRAARRGERLGALPRREGRGRPPHRRLQAERGNDLVLSGTFGGVKLAYLPTDRDLGVTIEIFEGTPSAEQVPDAT